MSQEFKNKLFKVGICFLSITVVCYIAIRLKINFFTENYVGDEYGFVESFRFFIDNGWRESNLRGHSVLFNLISYLFYSITKNILLSLKTTSLLCNIISAIIVCVIGRKIYNLKGVYLYGLALLSLNILVVSSFMFFAYTDSLLIPFILLFFYTVLLYKRELININKLALYSGIVLSLFMSIRLMTVVYLPVIILLLLKILLKSTERLKPLFIFLISFLIPIFLLNYNSILELNKLSYHKKENPAKDVSWSQLQYLSAIKKDKGIFTKDYHVSLDEVRTYIIENGDNSLPQKSGESLFFDIRLTIKEFFKDSFGLLKPFFRYTGVLIFGLIFLCYKRKEFIDRFIMLFTVGFMLTLSLIIISYIESRWVVASMLLLSVYMYVNQILYLKKTLNILTLNFFILALMNLPFIIKNFRILFNT